MDIFIIDDSNLGILLEIAGYSEDQIEAASLELRQRFQSVAVFVYDTILQQRLPASISVDLLQNTMEEIEDGSEGITYASFNPSSSDSDNLYFSVREQVMRFILDHSKEQEWQDTVIHEMLHSADQPVLKECQKILASIRDEVYYSDEDTGQVTGIALFNILHFLERVRGEGVAILGSHLLMRTSYGKSNEALSMFPNIFLFVVVRAHEWMINDEISDAESVEQAINDASYSVSPYILLQVLEKLGAVSPDLIDKAIKGLDTGDYNDMTEEEIITIIRAAFKTSLQDFINGLTRIGNTNALTLPLLIVCADLQDDYDEDNMKAFAELVRKPGSKDAFESTMEQIMGCMIPEDELDDLYAGYKDNGSESMGHTGLAERVNKLYSVLKNGENPNDRRIAQWALTYFFDDEDLIHDDIKGLGFVDDMAIMDYALELLSNA